MGEAEPLEKVVVQPRVTLVARNPIALSSATIHDLYTIKAAETWEMPRTFDPRDRNNHFAHYYSHLSETEYRAQVGRIARAIHHEVTPHKMQDVLYEIINSAQWMGQRRKGIDRHCSRESCAKKGLVPDTFESIEHAYCECDGGPRELCDLVLTRWNANTGERLRRDSKTIILGDRGDEWRAESEEVWRAVHACLLYVLHKSRRAAKGEDGAARQMTVNQMFQQMQKKLQQIAKRRLHWCIQNKAIDKFEEAWIESGLAYRDANALVHVTALHARQPTADPHDADFPPKTQHSPPTRNTSPQTRDTRTPKFAPTEPSRPSSATPKPDTDG